MFFFTLADLLNYFFKESIFASVVESILFTRESEVAEIESVFASVVESILAAVESIDDSVVELSLQATNAPKTKTISNFFMC